MFKGEIVGLLSMNEQGRDDLVQLLQQNLPLHYGFIYFNEQLVNSYQKSPMTENRVSVIDRRGRLVDDLTVADNIFVLRRGFKKYIVEPRVLRGQLDQFIRELQVTISADEQVAALTAYERCVVELLRAMDAGNSYEMYAVAASVIGGVSTLGGQGILLGTVIGASIWGVLQNGLQFAGAPVAIRNIVIGIIVVVSVLMDVVLRGGKPRRTAKDKTAPAKAAS